MRLDAMGTSLGIDPSGSGWFKDSGWLETPSTMKARHYIDHLVETWGPNVLRRRFTQNVDLGTPSHFALVHWPAQPIPEPPVASLDNRALAAINHLSMALELSDVALAGLIGVSRNTIRNWRTGDRPHAKTTRRLFEIHAVLSAVERLEAVPLAQWTMATGPNGGTWMEVLAEPGGPAAVMDHYRSSLFGRAQPRHIADVDLDGPEEDGEWARDGDESTAVAARGAKARRPAR